MAIKRNPYPILENEHGDFESFKFDLKVIDAGIVDGVFSFHFMAEIDEPELLSLLNKGKIKLHVRAVSNPYFGHTFSSDNSQPDQVRFQIRYEDTPASFDFRFKGMLLAMESMNYQNKNADTPLNQFSFKINRYQILARSYINISFDIGYKEHQSSAIIKLVKLRNGLKPSCGSYDINLTDQNQIIVTLAEDAFNKLMALNSGHQKILDSLITMPVLQYALADYLKNSGDYEDGLRGWFNILDDKYSLERDIKDMRDVLKKCNEILENPLIPFVDHFQKKYLID
jgi:hypothetical protein